MMTNTISNPLGKGTGSAHSITFSTGCGVADSVSSSVNWAEILELARNPQSIEKNNARWILPNDSPARKIKNTEYSHFGVLWADIDKPPKGGLDEVISALNPQTPYLAYATKSATINLQKCRILVPLLNPFDFGSWLHNQKRLNAVLEGAGIGVDSCNLKPNQILFLPNRGEHYAYRHREGLFNAKPLQAERPVPYTPPTTASISPSRGGVIDRFNVAYSVADILRQAGYDQCPSNPLQWRHPRSESGSYSASIDPSTGRVHSLSSRDPLYTGGGGQGAHDSFSAFQVLFCGGRQRRAVYEAANFWLSRGWHDER